MSHNKLHMCVVSGHGVGAVGCRKVLLWPTGPKGMNSTEDEDKNIPPRKERKEREKQPPLMLVAFKMIKV